MIAKIILVLLMTFSLGMSLAQINREKGRMNFLSSLLSYLLIMILLYWAGFFESCN